MQRNSYWWRGVAAAALVFAAACNSDDVTPTGTAVPDQPGINPAVSVPGTVNNPTPAGTSRLMLNVFDLEVMHKGACFIAAQTGGATGTGLYKPFLRVNVNKTWYQGFNTDTRPIAAGNDAEANSNWTIDIKLSSIPTVMGSEFPGCAGGAYREVRMDINQANPLDLALNQIRVYTHEGKNGGNLPALADLRWSLDNGDGPLWNTDADFTVIAKKLASGSGRDDLILLIPESAFPADHLAQCPYDQDTGTSNCNIYFTFFNEGGSKASGTPAPAIQNAHDATVEQSSGFEEWGVILRPIPARLTLVKKIVNDHGGTVVTAAPFNIQLAGQDPPVFNCVTAAPTTTCTSQEYVLGAGTYNFSEVPQAGYTAGNWSCTRTAPSAQGPVAAGAPGSGSRAMVDGEAWTCEITNNDDPGELIFIKRIVNDNGGTKVVGDFGITTTAGALSFGTGAVDGSTTTYTATALSVSAGAYTMSENNVAGYVEGNWECKLSSAGDGTYADAGAYNAGAVTVANGQSKTCRITNNDQAAELIFIKRVTNDHGGNKVVGDFGITTTAGALVFGGGVGGPPTTTYTATALSVSAGAYTMSENNVAGYTEGNWECKETGAADATYADAGAYNTGAVTVANGQSKTCRITNNDDPAKLTLIKVVTNDHGGTKTVNDFTLSANGPGTDWDFSGISGSADVTNKVVGAGTYALSEPNVAGYTEGNWFCKNTGAADGTYADAGAFNAGSVVLANGDDKTCRIINNDDPAKLTLIKVVTNDHGGTKTVADFTLSANGPGTDWDFSGISGSADVTNKVVGAGTYALSEPNVAGYTEGNWFCKNTGAADGTYADAGAFNAGSVVLANGDDKTCRVINDDDPGYIILIKRVDNLYGGVATASDFGITLDAGATVFGAGALVGTITSYSTDPIEVSAGSHSFAELDVAGYTEGTWSCTPVAATGTAYNAGSVNVANGQTVTCEITNTQEPLEITTETAWAANALGTCCSLRYNSRGNWATYVAYAGVSKTVTLYAGQTQDVGTVHFSAPSGGNVTITINLTGGWMFADPSVVAVQGYSSAPSGNPAPGQFANKESASGTSHVIVVPLANFYGVHAVVYDSTP